MAGPVSFDRIADRYDATRGGRRGGEFATTVQPWLAGGTVLEVGVGTGLVAAALAARGASVVGVDISAGMLARAYGRLGARVARADARALPIRAESVATVLFAMVLHVVGDVPAAMAEAARVLRPGGRVVAVHAAPEAEPTDLGEAMMPLDGRRTDRLDSERSLTAATGAAGLRTLHEGQTAPYPVADSPNAVADRIEQRIWSYLWRLDDEAWNSDAVPAIRALRALPEPDRPRRYTQRHRLAVFVRA